MDNGVVQFHFLRSPADESAWWDAVCQCDSALASSLRLRFIQCSFRPNNLCLVESPEHRRRAPLTCPPSRFSGKNPLSLEKPLLSSRTHKNSCCWQGHALNWWIGSLVSLFFTELDANGHCAVLSRFSRVQLCVTPWTVAHQAPLSMGILQASILEWVYCHSFPSPGDLPNPGIEPMFLMSPALAGRFFTTRATWEAQNPHAELTNKNANYRIPFLERASHAAQLVKHLQ